METIKSKNFKEPMMNLKVSPEHRPRTESLVKQNSDFFRQHECGSRTHKYNADENEH